MIDIVDTMQDRMFKLLDPKYYWAEREDYSVNNGLVLLPTGDGYGISLNNREKDEVILDLAAELHQTFSRIGRFEFRMGVARGRNLVTLDLNGNVNVFGYGVVRATRVCNAARPKQILVDSVFANSLLQKSRSFRSLLSKQNLRQNTVKNLSAITTPKATSALRSEMKEEIIAILRTEGDACVRFEMLENFYEVADSEADILLLLSILNNDDDPCVRHEAAAQLFESKKKRATYFPQ